MKLKESQLPWGMWLCRACNVAENFWISECHRCGARRPSDGEIEYDSWGEEWQR